MAAESQFPRRKSPESMTSWITRAVFLALLAASGAFAQPAPLVVGAALPESGNLADLAAGYRNALLLWQEQVNAAGGLLGRSVELRLLDDRSEAVRDGALYRQLIAENVDLLIGPYGSAATLMAAAEAESAHRVLINGAGWSREVHKRLPRYIFQSAVPYAAYGAGIVELARQNGCQSVQILARDDLVAREMALAAHDAALRAGLKAGDVAVYGTGTVDFAPQVAHARAAKADGWISFGVVRDAAEMIKTFKKLDYAPRVFFARDASQARRLTAEVGQDAEYALGAVEYDARLATPGNPEFVRAYTAKWSRSPGPSAAEGYAAATVLAEALRRAGAVNQDKLRAVLAALEMPTVLGRYKVDPQSGEQIGAQPSLVQILHGRAELVWPPSLQSAKPVLPYPRWADRHILE